MSLWVVGGGEGFDYGGEFEDFDLRRAVGPVVAPANDYVTTGVRVAVVAEIAALKFKFDEHALPSFGSDLAHGFAIGEAGLDGLDHVAEFVGEHAEEEDDTLLVHRLMAEAVEIDGIAMGKSNWTRGVERRGDRGIQRGRRKARCGVQARRYICTFRTTH